MLSLDAPVSALSRVGSTLKKTLETLGIETCRDVLFHFPFRFDDYSLVLPMRDVKQNMSVTVQGTIQLIANRRSKFKKKVITEALIADETGTLKVIWFNQSFLLKNLNVGDRVSFSGRTNENYLDLQLVSPSYEIIPASGEHLHTGRLVPVYSLTEKIGQKQFRTLVKNALAVCHQNIKEWLPDVIRSKESFMELLPALQQIHFPESVEAWNEARERLAFDELFVAQLFGLRMRNELRSIPAPVIPFDADTIQKFVSSLPFQLTDAQKKALWEILQDFQKGQPMNRLLEGDVGSGKTVVAAAAAYAAAVADQQTAYMAPTEILARQQFEVVSSLLRPFDIPIALYTSKECKLSNPGAEILGSESKKEVQRKIAEGEVSVIIGTHALIQRGVEFADLGFALIDEQHRFGVHQRKLLREKRKDGKLPHLLSMTATPIPRSLALTVYGDLDLSIIDQLPKGRKEIVTKVVPAKYRQWTYQFIRRSVKRGRQVFIVCPLIDPSDALGVRSVKAEYERLATEVFPDLTIGMMHGKMKQQEKEAVMHAMAENTVHILVSTSVIEVGIDIPNATIMLIEGAERFGLAQLHQFRGRVGRSDHQSYCFLLPSTSEKEDISRLQIMVSCADGFALAEKDLELRGPGDFLGTRQSGILSAYMQSSLADVSKIKKARDWAENIMEHISDYPEIKIRLEQFEREVHLE